MDTKKMDETVAGWLETVELDGAKPGAGFNPTLTFAELEERLMRGEDFDGICCGANRTQHGLCIARLIDLTVTNWEFWYQVEVLKTVPQTKKPTKESRRIGSVRIADALERLRRK